MHPARRLATLALSSLAATAAWLLLAASASAQVPTDAAADVGTDVATFGIGDWAGLGLRLALVVVAIWAGVAAMRWWVRRMNGARHRGALGALEVLETHALGPNRALHLVRLGDRAVLIGATQERITQLLTVEDAEELERLTARPEEDERGSRPGAMSLLSSLKTGLMTMNARRAALEARARAQKKAQKEAQKVQQVQRAEAPQARPAASRTSPTEAARSLKSMLSRPRREQASSPPAAEPAPSFFDQVLASASPAADVAAPTPSSAALRARGGYGQTGAQRVAAQGSTTQRPAPRGSAATRSASRSREEQIAELQRVIAAARRNAG